MRLTRWFLDLLYGSTAVEFESSFGLDESIARLKAASVRSAFFSLTRQAAVGTVKESRVSLQRAIPMFHNSFKPFFIGRFTVRNGRVVLVGRFSMLWFTKAFMSIWLGFCLLWTIMTFALPASHNSNTWWFPLFGIGMACAGIGFVCFCKWLSRKDAAWLSEVIKNALSGTHNSWSKDARNYHDSSKTA